MKRSVLIVDDDLLMREYYLNLLTPDYEIILAADGREAMEIYEQHRARVGAVISDLNRPRINGLQFIEWLHEQSPDMPVILSTQSNPKEIK